MAGIRSGAKRTTWFHAGHRAFAAAFPAQTSSIPFDPFYVCPLCFCAFSEAVLADGELTLEDVPPKSVGGRPLVLTCRSCNNQAGYAVDRDTRREADVRAFSRGENVANLKAWLATESGTVPIRLSASNGVIQASGIPKAVHPDTHSAVFGDFGRAVASGGQQDVRFQIGLERFDRSLVEISWLRAGYLALFAALGYRFIVRPEMVPVREKIRDVDTAAEPTRFRITLRQAAKTPRLIYVQEPDDFRCFAMIYRHNTIVFPDNGDGGFYSRLNGRPDTFTLSFRGKEIPWPRGPVFNFDRQQ